MARQNRREQKLARKAQKTARKANREKKRARQGLAAPSLHSAVAEAEALLDAGDVGEAAAVLEEIELRQPRRRDVLDALLELYGELQDAWSCQAVCARIVELFPDDDAMHLALGGTAVMNGQLTTAYQAFGDFLARWPDHADATKVGQSFDALEKTIAAEAAKYELPEDAAIDVLLQHDQINLALQRGRYQRVCELADELGARAPQFTPALNNRGEAHFRLGRTELAIADAERVLELDAGNVHARANLTRYLFLSGRDEDAWASAELLKAAPSSTVDHFTKQAEALSFLGDWAGILEVMAKAARSLRKNSNGDASLLHHLAAVAAARVGDAATARKHWKRTLKVNPNMAWAKENLAALKAPPGERHEPWAYPFDAWLPSAVFEELADEMGLLDPGAEPDDRQLCVRSALARRPHVEKLLPALLDRGDPTAVKFAIRLATFAALPSLWPALRDFAFGQRGSDDIRYQAAMGLLQNGELTPGRHRMWKDGQWQDIRLTSFEISSEPKGNLPADAQRLANEANVATHQDRPAEAEALLVEALRSCPEDNSLAYNLAVAVGMQGREDEAIALVRELHARDPDYLFARVRLAQEAIADGNYARARELIDPLLERTTFHLSEYAAMCHAHISLLAAEGNLEGALGWLDVWENADPDDPRLDYWRDKLELGNAMDAAQRLLSSRRGGRRARPKIPKSWRRH